MSARNLDRLQVRAQGLGGQLRLDPGQIHFINADRSQLRRAKKTFVGLPRFANSALDRALTECKADTSWKTFENNTSGHIVMLDAPEWLADILLQAS